MSAAAWLPKKDSNPHKQSQSLSCYLYTIRQCVNSKIYYNRFFEKVNPNFCGESKKEKMCPKGESRGGFDKDTRKPACERK